MLKLLSYSAIATAVLAAAAFAADSSATPPMAKNGMFVNAKGMTLYTFDKDTPGKSACNGQCATNWPPMLVSDGGKAAGDWTVVTREDGQKQWAYKGKPVYSWVKDTKPGDTTGDGFMNGVWHTAKP